MLPKELEKRLQALEDLEAIKRLKTRYGLACDDKYNVVEMAKLITEGAEFENSRGERTKGRDAIIKVFSEEPKRITFACHYFVQPYIEINGNKAKGRWSLWEPATMADGQCMWMAGIEDDTYEKVNGEWLIASTKVTMFFRAPYGKGWNKPQ